MSQFKNLYDTNNKLNALPLAQQTGSQQQTDYNNALTIYNNYLNSVKPVYSTQWGGSPAVVSSSGIYKILQFNTSQTFNIVTTAPKRINFVLVGGGGSGGCCSISSESVYGAGGGGGGGITSGSFIQPAYTNVVYTLAVGAGGVALGTNSSGASGGSTNFSTVPQMPNITIRNANGGTGGISDQTYQAQAYDSLYLNTADGVDQTTNKVKYIYLSDQVTETVSSLNTVYRYGGWYNNNISDLPDGYTIQIGPSYVKRLGGGGGGGSASVAPSVVFNNTLWGGGAGGYLSGGLAQSGLPNTGGGGGGERPYNGTVQSNSASGGSGTAIFFFENDIISTPIQNNTQISNAVETISTSQGNYKYGLLNNFIFNPTNNLGLLNVSLKSTIQSVVAINNLSTYMKNNKIKQTLYSSYLPNGSPNSFYIDYTLNPLSATNYKATGHNFYFNTYTGGTNSIYYGNLYITNLPQIANRIYTFNFYTISRYNNHNTVFSPATINVNTVDITLNGVSNITFPTTNTYNTQKITVISSSTLPLSFFAYTTVQSVNISDIVYVITPLSFATCQGAYGCKLLNSSYTGAAMTLRASGGTGASSDFYADSVGNLTTAFGSGTTLASWLTTQGGSTTYAFVSTWYDQSVTTLNNATQATTGSQPIYDVANKLLNFGYTGANGGVVAPQTNCFFNLPDGALPYNNTSYTYTFKHWNVGAGFAAFFWGGSQTVGGAGCGINITTTGYLFTWYGDDYNYNSASSNTQKNVVSFKYSTGGSRYSYVNGVSASYTLGGARTQPNTGNYIGRNAATANSGYPANAQMYYFYVFGSSLSDSDRITLEAT